MKESLLVFGFILLSGCVDTGYQPSYIISDSSQEERLEIRLPEQQEEIH